MIKVPIIEVVLFVINEAHNDQSRMDGSVYYGHCFQCVAILRNVLGIKQDESDQAMLLHDVEEDCAHKGFDLRYLQDRFGDPADLAHWLCKPPRDPGVDKLVFNANCYRKLASAAPEVCRQMKIADRLQNLSDPHHWNPRFRKMYLADTLNFIGAFGDVPNVDLIRQRYEIIRDGLD
jgi:(p)ppGpp synthase/HD superfamily hydrolase